MQITKFVQMFLETLPPEERDRTRDWAGRIAAAWGRDTITPDDVRAAVRCAGEEFLPAPGEYVYIPVKFWNNEGDAIYDEEGE